MRPLQTALTNMMLNMKAKQRRPITFVICAAGKGERFLKHGLQTPKPLLKLNGQTMLDRSIASLNTLPCDQIIIIYYKDHALKQNDKYDFVEITHQTRGQLETFMLAKDKIINDEVVIYNCDTYFESQELNNLIEIGLYDGIIPCSKQPGDAWSFCQIDDSNNILKVAEKSRISEWASVGYYYFKNKSTLFELAKEELASIEGKEVYVAPLYDRYIQRGLKIKLAEVEIFKPFGTIEQIRDYWGISVEDFIYQNS